MALLPDILMQAEHRKAECLWQALVSDMQQVHLSCAAACWSAWSQVMAPFTPFLCELMYQNLRRVLPAAPQSVHWCDFPEMQPAQVPLPQLCPCPCEL